MVGASPKPYNNPMSANLIPAAEVDLTADTLRARPVPVIRWLAMAVLLAIELVTLGVIFDGEVLASQPEPWARFMEQATHAVTPCIAVVAAAVVIGRRRLWIELMKAHQCRGPSRSWKAPLVVHLTSWCALVAVTHGLFSGKLPAAGDGAGWAIAWVTLATATMWFWASTILPITGWLRWTFCCCRLLAAAVPLGVAAWAAAFSTRRFGWNFLGDLTLCSVHKTLSLIYANVVYHPAEDLIGTPMFQVEIGAPCAGYEGIGLISVFLVGYLMWARKQLRFPQALVLLPIGVVMVWLANVSRIVVLIAIGSAGFPDVARGGFHSQAGWLAFNAIALGLVAMAGRSGWFTPDVVRHRAAKHNDLTAAYLMPFLSIVAASMITGAVSAGFDWLYGLRVVAAAALLLYFWSTYALRWSLSWQPFAFGAAAFFVWWLLIPVDPMAAPPEQLKSAASGWAAGWLSLRIFGYVVTAPLAEEIAFRGFLMRRFASADFYQVPLSCFHWAGFAGSSLLFGLMHGHNWLPATAAGIFFAWAAYRRGNLIDAVIAHATTNALVTIAVFASGAWYLWG